VRACFLIIPAVLLEVEIDFFSRAFFLSFGPFSGLAAAEFWPAYTCAWFCIHREDEIQFPVRFIHPATMPDK
jgi:hypothetical protein